MCNPSSEAIKNNHVVTLYLCLSVTGVKMVALIFKGHSNVIKMGEFTQI